MVKTTNQESSLGFMFFFLINAEMVVNLAPLSDTSITTGCRRGIPCHFSVAPNGDDMNYDWP